MEEAAADLIARFRALDDRGERDAALAILNEAFRRFSAGDRGALFEVLAPDVEWVIPDISLQSGVSVGTDAVSAMIDEQLEPFDSFVLEPEEYLRDGDTLAIFVRQRARGSASGAEVEIRIAHVWTIRDDKIVRFEAVAKQDEARRRFAY